MLIAAHADPQIQAAALVEHRINAARHVVESGGCSAKQAMQLQDHLPQGLNASRRVGR
jgi:hypothetical protein